MLKRFDEFQNVNESKAPKNSLGLVKSVIDTFQDRIKSLKKFSEEFSKCLSIFERFGYTVSIYEHRKTDNELGVRLYMLGERKDGKNITIEDKESLLQIEKEVKQTIDRIVNFHFDMSTLMYPYFDIKSKKTPLSEFTRGEFNGVVIATEQYLA